MRTIGCIPEGIYLPVFLFFYATGDVVASLATLTAGRAGGGGVGWASLHIVVMMVMMPCS